MTKNIFSFNIYIFHILYMLLIKNWNNSPDLICGPAIYFHPRPTAFHPSHTRCHLRLQIRIISTRRLLIIMMIIAFARPLAPNMWRVCVCSLDAASALLSARALSSTLRRVLLIVGGSTHIAIQTIIATQTSVLSRSRLARPAVDPLTSVCDSLSISLSGVGAL
jgi:hypothetical protein